MIIEVTLYGKEDCGLCDEVRADLIALSADIPLQINEIDIRTDPDAEFLYFDRIPVVEFGDVHLEAPLTYELLKTALETYQRRNHGRTLAGSTHQQR